MLKRVGTSSLEWPPLQAGAACRRPSERKRAPASFHGPCHHSVITVLCVNIEPVAVMQPYCSRRDTDGDTTVLSSLMNDAAADLVWTLVTPEMS